MLFEISRYFEYSVQTFEHEHSGKVYSLRFPVKSDLWNNDIYQLIYKTLFLSLFRIIIPLTITTILTGKLVMSLIQRRKNRITLVAPRQQTSKKRDTKETMTFVLIFIAIAFIITQLPGAIYPILRIVLEDPTSCDSFFSYFVYIADTLTILNSALNIFIYYPTIPAFRTGFWKLIGCRCKCQGHTNRIGPTRSSNQIFVINTRTSIHTPE